MDITAAAANQAQTVRVDELLQAAVRALQSGRLQDSEKLRQDVAQANPDQPSVWFLLGLVANRAGKLTEAIRYVDKAASMRPAQVAYQRALGELCYRADRLEEAAAAFERALTLEPSAPTTLMNLGLAQIALGRREEGLTACLHGLKGLPTYAGAKLRERLLLYGSLFAAPIITLIRARTFPRAPLATLAYQKGRLYEKYNKGAEARLAYRRALELAPDYQPALCRLARRSLDGLDFRGASRYLDQATACATPDAVVLADCGAMLLELARYDKAAAVLEAALVAKPNVPGVANRLAWARLRQGRPQEALSGFKQILRARPQDADAHYGAARCLQALGRLDEARSWLGKALAVDSRHVESYRALALNGQLKREDPAFVRLLALLDDGRLLPKQRATLHFAAAVVYESSGETASAFKHHRLAHLLTDVIFSPDACRAAFDEHMRVFDRAFFQRTEGWGDESDVPVFIVGLPRSGTTLVEQILASHSQVSAAGELEEFNHMASHLPDILRTEEPYPRCVDRLDKGAVAELASAYLAAIEGRRSNAVRVTDKMPGNFLHLGLIASVFPNARVIHCRRDPMDVCLSIYFKSSNFSGYHPYAHDLYNLGFYYRQYERLMEHWCKVLPIPVLDVSYEEVVADQERATRRILGFCGLDWEDRCLRFFETDRPVLTTSYAQVRQPISRSAVGRWKKCEHHLGPLKAGLAAA